MRVLIINELYKSGGAEMQTLREGNLLRQFGHECLIITLDPSIEYGWISKYHYNIGRKDGVLKKQLQMIFSDRQIVKELKIQIQHFKPDYIHLNNAKSHAISIYKVLENYKCIQTIRDYGAVCPKTQCIKSDLSLCEGYKNFNSCIKHCFSKGNFGLKNLWHWIGFKRRNKMQRIAINQFLCPSQMLTDYCNISGMNTICINNPFDFSLLDSQKIIKRINFQSKIYLYYGQIIGFKGIQQLIEAFSEFSRDKNDVELYLAGMLPEKYKQTFNELIDKYGNKRIKYIGQLKYTEMIDLLSKVHTVVIPSLWIENYPNTALEAMAVGCLAIASERGGMREIIGNDEYIFEILNKKSIIEKMELVYTINENYYMSITKENKIRVRKNNSMEGYYLNLKKCLRELD